MNKSNDTTAHEVIRSFTENTYEGMRGAVLHDGTQLICATDFYGLAGIRNTSQAIKQLDPSDAYMLNIGGRNMWYITPKGAFDATLRMRSGAADTLRRSGAGVLAEVQQTGSYLAPGLKAEIASLQAAATRVGLMLAELDETQGVTKSQADRRDGSKALARTGMPDACGDVTVTVAARQLAQAFPDVTRRECFDVLREGRVICQRDNAPTRWAIDRGLATQHITARETEDGRELNPPYARLTTRGVQWLAERIAERRKPTPMLEASC